MKGKVIIEAEDGTCQEFDCYSIKYNWNRDIPYMYDLMGRKIGIHSHTANLSIEAVQLIPLEIFDKPLEAVHNSNIFKSCDWCCETNCKKRECADKEELRDRMETE